jgi:hypothetical protein
MGVHLVFFLHITTGPDVNHPDRAIQSIPRKSTPGKVILP